jgi:hypothetical protein
MSANTTASANEMSQLRRGPGPAPAPVLPSEVVIPLGTVDSFFPKVTRVVSTGPNETSLGSPQATIAVIYGNGDSSVKVTISVDEYRSAADASSAHQQALQASEQVPGFHPIPAPTLGQQAFAGSVTMGTETHIGSGVLNGRVIVGVTLAGLDATQQNIANLFAIAGMENTVARLIMPLVNLSGFLQHNHTPAGDGGPVGLKRDTVGDKAGAAAYGGGNVSFTGNADQVFLGSGNATLLGGGSQGFFTAGGGGSRDTVIGGAGLDTKHSTGRLFPFDATSHGGAPIVPHFDFAQDKLHPVGGGTAHAPGSTQLVGGSMVLGDGTTITPQNFTGSIGKHIG